MVKITEDNKIHIKILYWGIAGSGKTTILDTLYRLTKEKKKGIVPISNLQKIARASGATLYFDKGIFQSTKSQKVYYRVYTVAGQTSFSPLRSKVFEGTDGVIFVVNSETRFFEDNIESLKELKNVSKDQLINKIPLIIMMNKQDIKSIIEVDDFKQILKDEKLWFEPGNKLHRWNPLIYKTCALYNLKKDIYRSFSECARRTGLYHIYGNGHAPSEEELIKVFIKN